MKNVKNQKAISLIVVVVIVALAFVIAGLILFFIISKNNTNVNNQLAQENTNGESVISSRDNVSINFTSPKEIFSAKLPNSGDIARPSRTYKASSSQYNKNNSKDFDKYFSFESGKGWKVKKSGLYSISTLINAVSYNNTASGLISCMTINEKEFEILRDYYTGYQPAVNSGQYVTFLEEGDLVDFTFTFSAACDYNYNNITVYALFE